MYIKRIEMTNFRNYEQEGIALERGINIFHGNNAQGKTNILEAVNFCALGKSFRTSREEEMIGFDKETLLVETEFSRKKEEVLIQAALGRGQKKNIRVNGVRLQRLLDLYGNLNVVVFVPDDVYSVMGTPAGRRRFIDILISQINRVYLFDLHSYFKTIEQRNALLRSLHKNRRQMDTLDVWDERLALLGSRITEKRSYFVQRILQKAKKIHRQMSGQEEEFDIRYISQMLINSDMKYSQLMIKYREKDIERGFTSIGPHRDDLAFLINQRDIGMYGSQGQQRTALLSLKLAEREVIKEEAGEYPVLLMDDVMAELDSRRRRLFFGELEGSQALITCTDLASAGEKVAEARVFEVKEGRVREDS